MYKDYKVKLDAILDRHKGVQKTDLGLVDDLAKAADKAESYIKKNEKKVKEFIKLKSDVDSAASEWKQIFGAVNGLTQKVYKAVKDLGLSMKEASQNPDVKKGSKARTRLEDFRDLLRKAGEKI
tara:strand:- start:589 stop:960 length:372 start_codon:yes stop_codon:yes gene_type:complete